MTATDEKNETAYSFDDSAITWHKLGDFEHFVFAMLNVDEDRKIVDAILKFEPNQQIFLHRHLANTNTFVVQGEHLLYEPDGRLKDTRIAGSYTSTEADPNPHTEGGGSEGAVVMYNIRSDQETLFEILDGDLNVVGTLGMTEFKAAFDEQTDG